MNKDSFRKHAHEAVDWIADYLENIEKYPVKSQVQPKGIYNQVPKSPPEVPEEFSELIKDLDKIIMPGITHWQHPNFHAYFPGNSSYPSVIGEIITAGLATQCMLWETSPAAAELEEKMMDWFKAMMDLPKDWQGVIQDSASSSTLAAILSAREKVSDGSINRNGFISQKLRIYCSTETHSSIDKAVKIAGIGANNLVKVATDETGAMIPGKLSSAIQSDLQNGFTPCCVIATLGTTSTLAFDPLPDIGQICQQHNIWMHVDAAYAGSVLILPEFRYLAEGLHYADSFVFNPHKWLFINFDCSFYFVNSKEDLINTFAITPEFLKTPSDDKVNNYRDWGVSLGRRFRALKVWFVIRTFGLTELQNKLRSHIELSKWLKNEIEMHPNFELLTPQILNMVVFRYVDQQKTEQNLDEMNENILRAINDSGKAYLSHTRHRGRYAIRLVTGQTNVQMEHIRAVWGLLQESIPKHS
ncbi:pyridoxal-dependent decarboxylase [Marinoscillum sp. MHG1-6]|uniref:pyridoxal phosphate-dependent decarboxylase family protein n=1 Tax=Marinoscillum sp. MHG1-6 TaxID=2959627 RepID=UPI002157AB8E|nr:pyridoxal-dependent decarboxylase [Marinoscillum sp. MHG1-6]